MLYTREDYDRARRVERAIDNAGNPMIDGREFFELKDPDGGLWRIRVGTAGVLSTSKVVGT